MYNTNNENSRISIKNLIIQFLFVALIIFLLIWLFPLKSDVKNLNSSTTNDNDGSSSALAVLVDRIFNENIIAMKDGAKSYYTTSRIPKNVGDKVKMTLGEMLDKKIVLPFTDKKGKACSTTDSYVEITKYDEEFIMKVNLKCGEEENYLLVYMGCYDYCTTGLCEKNQSDVVTPIVYCGDTGKPCNIVPIIPPTPEPTPGPQPDPQPSPTPGPTPGPENPRCAYKDGKYYDLNGNVTTKEEYERQCTSPTPGKDYLYEYKKVTNGYYTETDWSEWSTNKVTADANTSVQTKTVTTKKLTGYNVKYESDLSKPIYGTKTVETGAYETRQVCTKYDYVATGEKSYSDWAYVGDVYLTYSPKDTDTDKYIWVDDSNWVCGENCSSGTTHKYQHYQRSIIPITKYQCVNWEEKKTPITTTVQTITGYEQKVASKEPVYVTVTDVYYRYKTRKYHEGTVDIKWSVYNDTTLLSMGYSYTGNKKEKN